MNQVTLIGRLTNDPELRETKAGKPVCNLRLAVDGERGAEPTYVTVASFGAGAEACAAHLRKGRQVAVSGRLVFREWRGKDGAKRSEHSVWGSVEFLGGKPGSGNPDHPALELAA
ncbi:MAG: single-stranded DNA-binding protein [Acidimicrobiaceae bacterium]|nr:single-stranded DNA-binding protein [Acidimicrobiaceae bacterium]